MHAVSRLMLDNIPHVKAFWIATGVEVAQTALWFGVDDLDGTVQEEKIYHMAGARTPEAMTTAAIRRLIRAAGREPVERDTLYNVVIGPRSPRLTAGAGDTSALGFVSLIACYRLRSSALSATSAASTSRRWPDRQAWASREVTHGHQAPDRRTKRAASASASRSRSAICVCPTTRWTRGSPPPRRRSATASSSSAITISATR